MVQRCPLNPEVVPEDLTAPIPTRPRVFTLEDLDPRTQVKKGYLDKSLEGSD